MLTIHIQGKKEEHRHSPAEQEYGKLMCELWGRWGNAMVCSAQDSGGQGQESPPTQGWKRFRQSRPLTEFTAIRTAEADILDRRKPKRLFRRIASTTGPSLGLPQAYLAGARDPAEHPVTSPCCLSGPLVPLQDWGPARMFRHTVSCPAPALYWNNFHFWAGVKGHLPSLSVYSREAQDP